MQTEVYAYCENYENGPATQTNPSLETVDHLTAGGVRST